MGRVHLHDGVGEALEAGSPTCALDEGEVVFRGPERRSGRLLKEARVPDMVDIVVGQEDMGEVSGPQAVARELGEDAIAPPRKPGIDEHGLVTQNQVGMAAAGRLDTVDPVRELHARRFQG
ncbi:hypothetical protein D3C87_1039430 [compost metagenome]